LMMRDTRDVDACIRIAVAQDWNIKHIQDYRIEDRFTRLRIGNWQSTIGNQQLAINRLLQRRLTENGRRGGRFGRHPMDRDRMEVRARLRRVQEIVA